MWWWVALYGISLPLRSLSTAKITHGAKQQIRWWLHGEFQPGLKFLYTKRISVRVGNREGNEWKLLFQPALNTITWEIFIPVWRDPGWNTSRLSGLKLHSCNRNYFLIGPWPHGWDIGKTDLNSPCERAPRQASIIPELITTTRWISFPRPWSCNSPERFSCLLFSNVSFLRLVHNSLA